MIPDDVRCLESHEWARREADARIVTVGITDYAVEHLGDIVFLELPQVGMPIKKGTSFGSIESVKAASDLYAPVSGKVTAVNSALADQLELFKSDPYGQAWLVKIESADPREYDSLMDAQKYQQYVKGLA